MRFADYGKRISGLVASACLRYGLWGQFPPIHPTLDTALLHVFGGGPMVDAELVG